MERETFSQVLSCLVSCLCKDKPYLCYDEHHKAAPLYGQHAPVMASLTDNNSVNYFRFLESRQRSLTTGYLTRSLTLFPRSAIPYPTGAEGHSEEEIEWQGRWSSQCYQLYTKSRALNFKSQTQLVNEIQQGNDGSVNCVVTF